MKTRRLWITGLAAFLLTAFIGGCKDENVEKVGLCPLVVSTNPANLATGVPLNQVITITFNEAMDPATIMPTAFSLTGPVGSGRIAGGSKSAAEISGSLTYDAATYTMSFTPSPKLNSNSTYTGTVATSVKDLTGNALQVSYVWTFSTGTTVLPSVVATDPVNNATGVFLNKVVTATFNAPMDPLTITASTFTLKQGTTSITGAVTYTGTMASFTPAANLTANTLYTATITAGAKNVGGTALANAYVWSFTTGTISAPKVNSTDPLSLATGVALNKVVSAIFSEAMDPLTITASSFTVMIGTNPVSGVVAYSGTTATFTPTSNLLSSTTYTATITTAAKNVAGTPIANDYVWNFNTNATLGPLVINLQSVERFGIIAGVGVSNDAGFSVINNLDVGIYPGVRSSITGFPPAIIVGGAMYASDDLAPPGVAAMLLQAQNDLTTAYNQAAGATLPAPAVAPADLGGKTLAPGIYTSATSMLLQNGDLTLDAQGDANAVWIFQIGSTLTSIGTAPFPSPSGGNVILAGGAQAKNVFWQVSASATIGDYTHFQGTILAFSSITMNSGAVAEGRMLARNAAVTMTDTNIINKP